MLPELSDVSSKASLQFSQCSLIPNYILPTREADLFCISEQILGVCGLSVLPVTFRGHSRRPRVTSLLLSFNSRSIC